MLDFLKYFSQTFYRDTNLNFIVFTEMNFDSHRDDKLLNAFKAQLGNLLSREIYCRSLLRRQHRALLPVEART